MKISREWVGGSEEIDLDTEEGWRYFADGVVQDETMAEEECETLRVHGEHTINADNPEYFERWTVLPDKDEADEQYVALFTFLNGGKRPTFELDDGDVRVYLENGDVLTRQFDVDDTDDLERRVDRIGGDEHGCSVDLFLWVQQLAELAGLEDEEPLDSALTEALDQIAGVGYAGACEAIRNLN